MDSSLDQNSMTIRGGMVNDDGSRYYGGRFDQQLNPRNSGPRPTQNGMQMRAEAQRLEELERQIPPEAEDYPIAGPMDGPPKSAGVWSLTAIILASVALLAIIIFIAWYFGSGTYTKGNASNIKEIINNSDDLEPTLKRLTVNGNTTLGTDSADTLNVKADVSSNLIPDSTSGAYSLGSSSKQWGSVYVDNVRFDDGTITQASDDNVRLTGAGFGYRKPIQTIDLDTGSTSSLGTSTSGYTYVLSQTTASAYSLTLPPATTPGVFYNFLCGTSIASPGSFGLLTDGDDSFNGVIQVSTESGDGNVTGTSYLTSFSVDDDYTLSNILVFESSRPVANVSGLTPGVKQGSYFNITNYETGKWSVDGHLIVHSGVSIGTMVTPFYN